MEIDELDELDELNELDKAGIPWRQRLFLKFAPKLFLKFHARKMGVQDGAIDQAFKLFDGKRIDIQPFSSGSRGFLLCIDGKLTLWFYQDGDHFAFDGFEMGEYGEGDVTVFDGIKQGEDKTSIL